MDYIFDKYINFGISLSRIGLRFIFFIATNLRVMLFFVILPMYKITTDTIPFYIILIFIYWFFPPIGRTYEVCSVYDVAVLLYTHMREKIVWNMHGHNNKCNNITTYNSGQAYFIQYKSIEYYCLCRFCKNFGIHALVATTNEMFRIWLLYCNSLTNVTMNDSPTCLI